MEFAKSPNFFDHKKKILLQGRVVNSWCVSDQYDTSQEMFIHLFI